MRFYGEVAGVRIARKHIGWYTRALPGGDDVPRRDEQLEDCAAQLAAVDAYFDALGRARTAGLRADAALRRSSERRPSQTRGMMSARAPTQWRIERCVLRSARAVLPDLDGAEPDAMYEMVLELGREAADRSRMTRAGGNQTPRRRMLGINRNTLRKKLQQQKLDTRRRRERQAASSAMRRGGRSMSAGADQRFRQDAASSNSRGRCTQLGFELLSTGGTARAAARRALPVTEVSDYTGFPEMLDGRVKTLHPKIHGGLLARRDVPTHMQALAGARHRADRPGGREPLSVRGRPSRKPGCTLDDAIENIDIGGPAMLRAAAKN